MFSRLVSVSLIGRLLGGGRSRRGRAGVGRGSRRGRAGFLGPFPTYSTRTRRGSRVTVTGCCLPLPLVLVIGVAVAARGLARR